MNFTSHANFQTLTPPTPIPGTGYFGSVQRAENVASPAMEAARTQGVRIDKYVAIKEIDIANLVSKSAKNNERMDELETFESKMQREITNMRCISHPNIVSLLEYCSVQPNNGRPRGGLSTSVAFAGSKLYLTMELCPGKEILVGVMENSKQDGDPSRDPGLCISDERMLVALAKVGRAVQYLHATSIVHRDVKPENIGMCACNVMCC